MADLTHPIGLCLGLTLALSCEAPTPNPGREAQPAAQAKPAEQAEPGPRSAPDPDAHPPSSTPTPTPPSPGGRAYINVQSAGVFIIDEQGFRLFYTSRAPIRDLAEFDGQLHVLSSFGVQRVAGIGAAQTLAPLDSDSYAQLGEPVAMARDGEGFWVLGRDGVGHWDGAWTITPLPSGPWGSMALDGSLRAASADGKTILVHAGCSIDEASRRKLCTLERNLGSESTNYEIDATGCPDHTALAMSPSAAHVVLAGACGLVRLSLFNTDTAAAPPRRLSADTGRIDATPSSLAIDDGGRVWAGAHGVIFIVGADDQVERYPLAQLTDIAGPITKLVVTGAGPNPPTLGEVRLGGLRGTLMSPEGTPIAAAKVELCSQPRAIPMDERDPLTGLAPDDDTHSPCEGERLAASTTADAEGKFEATKLPIGHYVIAVEANGRWGLGVPKTMTMRVDMTGNVGRVVVHGLD